MSSRSIAVAYFEEHAEAKEGVWKAYYAYHVPHFRRDRLAHNFTSAARWSKCAWCGRTREDVRWDDLPAGCGARPASADLEIETVIQTEEQKSFGLIARAEIEIPRVIAKCGLSGATLALLHHTHGYDPETVLDVLGICIPSELLSEYGRLMGQERQRSKSAFKPELIEASVSAE